MGNADRADVLDLQPTPQAATAAGAASGNEPLSRMKAWVLKNRVDIAIVVAITGLAAAMRVWSLATVPLGLHGDEALTGLDAQRILDEGWIGPYVGSALGQPTGPLYFTALLFTFMPESTFTVRFSMALFGIATIPMAYLAFAQMFNRTVAAFAILILAVMMWHLHLSRAGFMLNSWPFIEMAALAAIWFAMKKRTIPWFLLAGALVGLGVYSYNVYMLFVPVAFLPIAWMVVSQRSNTARIGAGYMALLFAVAALLFAMPMLRFIYNDTDFYRSHQRVVSVMNTERWEEGGWGTRASMVWDRATEWHEGMFYGGRPDGVDGLSSHGHPPVHPLIYASALVGLGVAVVRIRRVEYAVLLTALVIIPWGALLTIDAGAMRRTFGLAPVVAVLAAIPLAAGWQALARRRAAWAPVAACGVLIIPAVAGIQAMQQYFGPVQDSGTMRFVFPYHIDRASHYMNDLPDGTYVYFYSRRWSINYETRQFIAPDSVGEDRSLEFRDRRRFPDDDAPADVTIDVAGPVAFVFLPPYLELADEAEERYPGGGRHEYMRGDELVFVAYHLPEGTETARASRN
jgi:4-amino-4-deoxy-L-arabinose transferase-like glycosyltransferase